MRQRETRLRSFLARAGALALALLCGGAGSAPAAESGDASTRTAPAPKARRWVVLPESILPWRAPSLTAPRFDQALRYPKTVEEIAHPLEFMPGDGEGEGDLPGLDSRPWIEFEMNGERAFLPQAYVVPWTPRPASGEDLEIGREEVDREHALPLGYGPRDLTALPPRWSYQQGRRHQLRREATDALVSMFTAARREAGVELRCVSSYRDAATQRRLYLLKIGKAGLEQNVVAKPGHSEHQLGTTADVSGLDPETVLRQSFGATPEGWWVKMNAGRFGFRLSYTEENAEETGYIPEPWHIRYVGLETIRRVALPPEKKAAPDTDAADRNRDRTDAERRGELRAENEQ